MRVPFTALPVLAALLLVSSTLAGLPARAGNAGSDTTREMARLRIEAVDGGYLAWADNQLAGPIEVRLAVVDATAPPSDPALPARASVPAGASVLVARLPSPANRRGPARLRLTAVPGSSNARPRDVDYLAPLATTARIDQGFDGAFSHADDENRYALDFAADEGTPIVAARGGTVMQVEADFRADGSDRAGNAMRANFIRILHDDGSMALYGHLANGGARVVPGQRVAQGEAIGASGNTGFSTAPHLHFVVQVNRGMRLVSIPFRMQGVAPAAAARPRPL
ncbi:M23 family metallopeptidase [Thermomonas brevis]